MNEYDVTLSVCTNVIVCANSEEEAIEIIKSNHEDGRQELIDAIDMFGFEIEIKED